jgi:hypothetical protein
MTLSRWPILSSRLHILPKYATDPLSNMVAGFLGIGRFQRGIRRPFRQGASDQAVTGSAAPLTISAFTARNLPWPGASGRVVTGQVLRTRSWKSWMQPS